jgi:hypothetical protein
VYEGQGYGDDEVVEEKVTQCFYDGGVFPRGGPGGVWVYGGELWWHVWCER